ncbi:MAG: secernin-3 [Candidatus Abyssobacteria bacterium SURF_5]|uniref:Dipeptidase n=1 Tax=Abyssobacteria bacterium (strain SURF_5) TaxID=2093360 RepID=A0A3A4NMT9_ABYX5|nr:MAG: secernin-3 [Candidatus Abyssubacteria bacterium SURF_5]
MFCSDSPDKKKACRQAYIAGCDTLVALASATADGSVVFGKNSDRPADESQPLCQEFGKKHERGSTVKCQYLEIPQVEETYSVIGSRPHWLWGFEHGVNEYGVAIGNEAVFTKEEPSETGLLGMDLVRLGLERGRTARAALEVITRLIEEYGQGGAAYEHLNWGYSNSFLIADQAEAYILETAGREYARKEIDAVGSISNHIAIGSDYDRVSKSAMQRAAEKGWWDQSRQFDFSAVYRSTEMVPPHISEERLRQSTNLLQEFRGKISPDIMMRFLRDHYESRTTFTPGLDPSEGRCYSICMHADPVGTTAASVVAHIRRKYPFVTYWASFGNPCCGVFLPLYLQGRVPSVLLKAGGASSNDSVWWLFKRLDEAVAADYASNTFVVQSAWAELESEFVKQAAEMEGAATLLEGRGKRDQAKHLLEGFMHDNVNRVACCAERLTAELG